MSVRFKNASVSEKCLLNIRIQWNAGTACVSECVLKTLACRGLRIGPFKFSTRFLVKGSQVVYHKSHHVTLPRCGCSNVYMEDVELWTCWICLLKVPLRTDVVDCWDCLV